MQFEHKMHDSNHVRHQSFDDDFNGFVHDEDQFLYNKSHNNNNNNNESDYSDDDDNYQNISDNNDDDLNGYNNSIMNYDDNYLKHNSIKDILNDSNKDVFCHKQFGQHQVNQRKHDIMNNDRKHQKRKERELRKQSQMFMQNVLNNKSMPNAFKTDFNKRFKRNNKTRKNGSNKRRKKSRKIINNKKLDEDILLKIGSKTNKVKMKPIKKDKPSKMESPTCECIKNTSLKLSWIANDDNFCEIDNFQMDIKLGHSNKYVMVYMGLDFSYTIKNLKPGCNYQFRIRAHNAIGWSEWSDGIIYRTNGVKRDNIPEIIKSNIDIENERKIKKQIERKEGERIKELKQEEIEQKQLMEIQRKQNKVRKQKQKKQIEMDGKMAFDMEYEEIINEREIEIKTDNVIKHIYDTDSDFDNMQTKGGPTSKDGERTKGKKKNRRKRKKRKGNNNNNNNQRNGYLAQPLICDGEGSVPPLPPSIKKSRQMESYPKNNNNYNKHGNKAHIKVPPPAYKDVFPKRAQKVHPPSHHRQPHGPRGPHGHRSHCIQHQHRSPPNLKRPPPPQPDIKYQQSHANNHKRQKLSFKCESPFKQSKSPNRPAPPQPQRKYYKKHKQRTPPPMPTSPNNTHYSSMSRQNSANNSPSRSGAFKPGPPKSKETHYGSSQHYYNNNHNNNYNNTSVKESLLKRPDPPKPQPPKPKQTYHESSQHYYNNNGNNSSIKESLLTRPAPPNPLKENNNIIYHNDNNVSPSRSLSQRPSPQHLLSPPRPTIMNNNENLLPSPPRVSPTRVSPLRLRGNGFNSQRFTPPSSPDSSNDPGMKLPLHASPLPLSPQLPSPFNSIERVQPLPMQSSKDSNYNNNVNTNDEYAKPATSLSRKNNENNNDIVDDHSIHSYYSTNYTTKDDIKSQLKVGQIIWKKSDKKNKWKQVEVMDVNEFWPKIKIKAKSKSKRCGNIGLITLDKISINNPIHNNDPYSLPFSINKQPPSNHPNFWSWIEWAKTQQR